MNLLHVDSSILGGHSASRALSAAATAELVAANPGVDVTYLDLTATPIPHLSAADLPSLASDSGENPYVDAFLAADIVVIGVALYNFTIPSQLKAWLDRLFVAGKTFRYGERGPEGLVGGKRVILTIARGGLYGPGSPAAPLEHAETYLRGAFAFLGVTDPEVIVAEGLRVSEDQRQAAMTAANDQIAALADRRSTAANRR
jgi:FMN-dependent NADH-azoreductase